MYRHARAARIYDGPDEVHRVSVARQVLAGYRAPDGDVAARARPDAARGGAAQVRRAARSGASRMPDRALPDYAVVNRAQLDGSPTRSTQPGTRASRGRRTMCTGAYGTSPSRRCKRCRDVRGLDVIELGCGTAYFGAWLKKLGARRVVGVDVTPAQLDTARAMDAQFGLGLEFIEANAENVPLDDASFDLAFSEYGASLWCDPYLWIPEAARLLRQGGELQFMRGTTLQVLCAPDEGQVGDRLVRAQKGMRRFDWPQDG